MTLTVPKIASGTDVLSAALEYAKAGWFVLPLKPDRQPLLKHWPDHTSRDPEQIVAWFAGRDLALGLHVGRSGAIAFDVDYPDELPAILLRHFRDDVPHQSTRVDLPERGHWIFQQPVGRYLGNGRGSLGKEWGEVRGANGFIVAEPSPHAKAQYGGRYHWLTTGPVPALPDEIADALPDFTGSNAVASDDMVAAFLDTFADRTRPTALRAITIKFNEQARKGSRHETLVEMLAWAMREASMGFFPAQEAVDALHADWMHVTRGEPDRFPEDEFRSVLAWAVGAALAGLDKAQARAEEINERLDATALLPDNRPPQAQPPVAGVHVDPEVVVDKGTKRLPEDYFDKSGLDVSLLADDVLTAGELAVGEDESFWAYRDGVWRREPKVVQGRVVRLLAGRFRGSHGTNAEIVVSHRVDRISCGPTPDYMNFRNGMLDWRTGEIVPHAPHYGSTVQFPIEWQADATCPKFERFLASILSPDYQRLAWEMIGYLMLSGNPLQKAFMLLGTGANGKGTLLRVVEELLGRDNIATQSLDALSGNRFAPVSLHGKIANLAGDIDATYQESTAQFKMLTGEDSIAAEHKYGASFMFRNWAVPVFSANRVPGSSDTSEGYLRRWVILEFAKTIPPAERIPGFSDLLLGELQGIAVKGVEALRDMMERASGRGAFHTAEDIEAGAERFAENIDQVRMWVASGNVLQDGAGQVAQTDAFNAYRLWAEQNGYGRLRSGEFFSRLDGIPGVKVTKIRGQRLVRGLTVVDPALAAQGEKFFGGKT